MEITMFKTPLSLLLTLNCLLLGACDSSNKKSVRSDDLPNASSAAQGSITFRVINAYYDGNGICKISLADLNNSGHDIRTLQISKYQAETTSGKTSTHSYVYDGLKNGESRLSHMWVKAPSCDDLTVDIASLLCRSMDDRNEICDKQIQFLFEGNYGVELTGSFKS